MTIAVRVSAAERLAWRAWEGDLVQSVLGERLLRAGVPLRGQWLEHGVERGLVLWAIDADSGDLVVRWFEGPCEPPRTR